MSNSDSNNLKQALHGWFNGSVKYSKVEQEDIVDGNIHAVDIRQLPQVIQHVVQGKCPVYPEPNSITDRPMAPSPKVTNPSDKPIQYDSESTLPLLTSTTQPLLPTLIIILTWLTFSIFVLIGKNPTTRLILFMPLYMLTGVQAVFARVWIRYVTGRVVDQSGLVDKDTKDVGKGKRRRPKIKKAHVTEASAAYSESQAQASPAPAPGSDSHPHPTVVQLASSALVAAALVPGNLSPESALVSAADADAAAAADPKSSQQPPPQHQSNHSPESPQTSSDTSQYATP
ncbi:hypothetical protein QCA50_015100 [Cerrena zonata]|uniref:Uncharacterized protein n=1 Tax=Cerrena zonata TaxID=2478898 RepID=A0AAW0FVZ4_9APHY